MGHGLNKIEEAIQDIKDGKVKEIFETKAKRSGNGAIIYVQLEYKNDKFYVVVCK